MMKEIEKFLQVKIDLPSEFDLDEFFGTKIPDEIKAFWVYCKSLIINNSVCYFSPVHDIEFVKKEIDDLFFNFSNFNNNVDNSCIPEEVKAYSYNKKWIPFIVDSGLYNFIDLDPSEKGLVGQIILKDMKGGYDDIILCAKSLEEVVKKLNQKIDDGLITKEVIDGKIELFSDDDFEIMEVIGLWE